MELPDRKGSWKAKISKIEVGPLDPIKKGGHAVALVMAHRGTTRELVACMLCIQFNYY